MENHILIEVPEEDVIQIKKFVSLTLFSNLFLGTMISNGKSSSSDDLSAILIAQIF